MKEHSYKLNDLPRSQSGINIVDLMMWIVIAAILLAAAIQGIGYYQQAAYLYQMQSDADGAGTLVNAKSAQASGVIDQATVQEGVTDSKWSPQVTGVAEGTVHPYIRVEHPAVGSSDVLYLFDNCGGHYKIGVNVVPKGGTPELEACGITNTPPSTGGGTGNGSGGTTTPVDYSYSGQLAAWGNGDQGLLATGYYMWMNYPGSSTPYTGPETKFLSPTNILDGKTVTAFDVSQEHACAMADGTPYCWGANNYGQLGQGTVDPNWWTIRGTPAPVVMSGDLAGKSFSKFAISDAGVTCGLIDSTAYCWGNNDNGQTGTGLTDAYVLTPTKVAGPLAGKSVTDIQTKGWGESVCAISEGSVYCWGANDAGQLGSGTTDYSPLPLKVGGLLEGKTATRLAMSINYGSTCAIADGAAYCWGDNSYGQLGAGMTPPGYVDSGQYDPFPVAVNTDTFPANAVVTDIAMGYNQTCAVVSGKAYCWGNYNNNFKDYGQLGRGNALPGETPLPKPVVTAGSPMDGKTVTSIAAADSTSYAIADGQLYGWGGDWTGQLGGDGSDVYIPVLINGGVLPGKTVKGIVPTWDTVFAIYG